MVTRDWSRAFRRASFRGARFWVDQEDFEGGRRLSVTDIAYGESPVVEDMGGRAKTWPVLAYVAGGVADAEAAALTSALHAPGASLLVLPMMPGTRARVQHFARNRRRDKNGYLAFDIVFVEAGGGVSFPAVLSATPIAALLFAGAAILSAALSSRSRVSTSAARSAAARGVAMLDNAGLEGKAWAEATTRGAKLTEAAEIASSDPASFAKAAVGFVWHVAREGDPQALARAMTAEMAVTIDDAGVGATWRAALSGGMGVVALRRSYPARQDAAASRSDYAAAVAPVLEEVGLTLGGDAYGWLKDLVGQAVVILSRIAADRAPLVRVESGVSLPSTRLAWELYQDPARAAELVERNKSGTPLVMPVAIEALAS